MAHVEENTILSMPAACAARSKVIVPATLFCVKAGRIADRLANFNSRGKMYDRERFVFPEHLVEVVPIPNIANFERTPFDKFSMTV